MAQPIESPKQALRITRLIWAAMLVGLVVLGFFFLRILLPQNQQTPMPPDFYHVILTIGLILAVPLAYFIRNQSYKRHWQGGAITPHGYFKSNLLLFAVLEGFSFACFVSYFLAGDEPSLLVYGGVTMVIIVINFPTGKPMQPSPPRVA